MVARMPVQNMIDRIQEQVYAIQNNPVGADVISLSGYLMVMDALRQNQYAIENGSSDPNMIWTVISEYAPQFTTVEYLQLMELASQVVE